MILARAAGLYTGGLRFSRRQWGGALLTVVLVALALLAPMPIPAPAPQVRHITVMARTYQFEPAVLHVNRGDTVVVTLESADVVHGMYVDGYGVSAQAEPGRPGDFTFVADRTGAFHFRCAVPCGNLHPFMIGKLVVEPNLTWLRAVAASLISAAGALAFFWRA